MRIDQKEKKELNFRQARDPGFNVFAGDWKDEHLRRAMAKVRSDHSPGVIRERVY